MSEKKRLIIKVTEADYAPLDDGYLYFWPDPAKGALSADNLREIADELDRRLVKIRQKSEAIRDGEILALACKNHDWPLARELARKYGIPVHELPGYVPM